MKRLLAVLAVALMSTASMIGVASAGSTSSATKPKITAAQATSYAKKWAATAYAKPTVSTVDNEEVTYTFRKLEPCKLHGPGEGVERFICRVVTQNRIVQADGQEETVTGGGSAAVAVDKASKRKTYLALNPTGYVGEYPLKDSWRVYVFLEG